MSELVLILADFHAPPAHSAQRSNLPRLAALELLLARGERALLPGGWRPWLAQQVCDAELAAIAPAGLAAAGWIERPAELHYWFATPVHYFAGLDSVHLHPAGLLQLSAEAQHKLCEDFARVFHDSGFRLYATARRELLLSGPKIAPVCTHDPAGWLGSDPSPGFPSGVGGPLLRRLGAEIELWLHEHPVNSERAGQGQLTVSALWLWGGAAAPPRRPADRPRGAATLPRLYADDAYCEGLGRFCGGRVEPLPPRWTTSLATPAARSGAGALVNRQVPHNAELAIVVLPTATAQPLAALERVNQRWLTPALTDLRSGRLAALSVFAGERRHRATRLHLWRLWRPLTPWWQALGTAGDPEETTSD